jgi:ABC-type tungstate transport system permease subunit
MTFSLWNECIEVSYWKHAQDSHKQVHSWHFEKGGGGVQLLSIDNEIIP